MTDRKFRQIAKEERSKIFRKQRRDRIANKNKFVTYGLSQGK